MTIVAIVYLMAIAVVWGAVAQAVAREQSEVKGWPLTLPLLVVLLSGLVLAVGRIA